MAEAIRLHTEVTGERPTGWYTGRSFGQHGRLVAEEGGFDYVSDTYDDELPYWLEHDGPRPRTPQLIIPYTLDANDMRFATPQGFNSGDQFFAYLKDSFDTLYAEGKAGRPRMMSHRPALPAGRPPGPRRGAASASSTTSRSHDKVWLARRIDIARHWRETPSLPAAGAAAFAHGRTRSSSPASAASSSIRRGSPSAPIELELGPAHDSAGGLHNALCRVFRAASEAERLGVLNAHPDLAGKLAARQAADRRNRPRSRPPPASTR